MLAFIISASWQIIKGREMKYLRTRIDVCIAHVGGVELSLQWYLFAAISCVGNWNFTATPPYSDCVCSPQRMAKSFHMWITCQFSIVSDSQSAQGKYKLFPTRWNLNIYFAKPEIKLLLQELKHSFFLLKAKIYILIHAMFCSRIVMFPLVVKIIISGR